MQNFKKIICLCLGVIILVCGITVTAKAEGQIANIVGSNVAIRTEANTKTSTVLKRVSNIQVTVLESVEGEQALEGGTTTWYKVTDGEVTGYVYGAYVAIYVYDEDFEKNLEYFPSSYHNSLRVLHAKYPNWKFVANNINITFNNAVEAQYGVDDVTKTRKWVEFVYGGNEWRDMRAYTAETNSWITLESRWTYASRAAIEYFMDPRNSLNEEMIFAFMQQSYQADEKMQDNLRTVIKGTFLENGYDKDGDGTVDVDAYIQDLMSAAQESGVSPYVLAATIIVEQGTEGTTNLISGTYPGYEGYYNFFNFSASGTNTDEITKSGLYYAWENGWNSREASIKGGAKKYADGYISVGQDTYYYKDFNVVTQNWQHQYATALYDAWTNAKYLRKGCTANTDATITFAIPVFADMPSEPCSPPSEVVIPDPPSNPEPTPEPVIKKGDTNNDGTINAVDLAAVKMHILGVKGLEGNAYTAGDVNGDGAINAVDLAAIKMHILEVKFIG